MSALRSLLVVLALGAPTAHAAEDLSAELKRCAAHADQTERLACYDRLAAAAGAPAAANAGDAATTTVAGPAPTTQAAAAQAATARAATPPASAPGSAPDTSVAEREFGARGELARELEEERGVRKPEQLERLEARVREVSRLPRGEFLVKLENGQVWAQNDPKPRMNLKPGDAVVLAAGAMGSFWLSAHEQRVRVSRVR